MQLKLAPSKEVSAMASGWENGMTYEIILSVTQKSFSDKGGFVGEAEIIDAYPADEETAVAVDEEMPPPPPAPMPYGPR